MLITQKNVQFELNEKTLTAKVILSDEVKEYTFIPPLIVHESQKYLVDNLSGSLKNSSIEFLELAVNLMIQIFPKGPLSFSTIQHLHLSDNIKEFEVGWCYQTLNLTKITVSPNNKYLQSLNGKILIGKMNEKDDAFNILYFASRDIESIEIPPTITIINSYSFENCKKIKTVQFSEKNNVQKIDKFAFSKSSIESIKIPNNVLIISDHAFYQCSNIKTIEIEEKSELFSIREFAFSESSLQSIFIPNKIKSIEKATFSSCEKLKSVEFSNKSQLSVIGSYAFFSSNLPSIKIPRSVTCIKEHAFSYCKKIESIEFDEKSELVTIEKSAFSNTSISTISIPDNVKSIEKGSFSYSRNMKTVIFSNESKLTTIGEEAFSNSSIEYIKIPKSVTIIGDCAFSFCEKIKFIEFNKDSKLNSLGKKAFSKSSISTILIPDEIKSIEQETFSDCKKLKSVKFSDESQLTNIDSKAFSNSNIEELYIPNKVERLNEDWCISTPKLKKIYLSPNNPNFISIGNKIIIGKSETYYDTVHFISREAKTATFPSNIKKVDLYTYSLYTEINKIELKKDIEYKLSPIWLNLPTQYQKMINSVNNMTIQNIYSKFEYKYYVFNEKDLYDENISFNLFIYLINFNFITFYMTNQTKNRVDVVICIEGECIFIEKILINIFEIIIKELNKRQITIINTSKNSIISLKISDEAKEEITIFSKEFEYDINGNYFIENTILPIACYLIRRYYCPSNYFIDKSFFNFDQKAIEKEQNIIFEIRNFLFNKNDNSSRKLTDIITNINELKNENTNNSNRNFNENDFIKLRTIYSKSDIAIFYLVIHRQSFHIFVLKHFFCDCKKKEIEREINFCKFSHSCLTQFYGFLIEKENIIGLIYDFKSNGQLNYFIEKHQVDEMYLLQCINRIFNGLYFLQTNQLIHRDIKPSNILIDHNNLAYISDYDSIRFNCSSEEIITNNIGSFLYTSPEQDIGNNISYSTDIYSFGLIIYFLFEKEHRWKDSLIKDENIKLMTKGSKNLQNLYERCVQYKPNDRISKEEIKIILNEEFNSFVYFDKYLQNDKFEINNEQLIYFIYEKLKNQQTKESLSLCKDQILKFQKLFLTKIESHHHIQLKQPKVKNDIKSQKFEFLRQTFNMSARAHIPFMENMHGNRSDYLKAIKYYENKYGDDGNYKGNLSYKNAKSKQDYLRAKEYFEESIKHNNDDSLNKLGTLYEKGLGVKQNYEKAREYYEKSAKYNNAEALYNLGNLYEKGLGVRSDYLKAIEYYEKSAKYKNYDAFLQLGYIYVKGLGVKQDCLKAMKYYEQSAEHNNSYALNILGDFYYNGLGVKRDINQATIYYEKSAELDNDEALFNLGYISENEIGVEQEYDKARKYYEKSSKFNNSKALNNLGNLYKNGLGVKQDYEQARKYYEQSSKLNNSCALENLGNLYEKGLGVEQDYLTAKKYYEQSAEHNNSYAFNDLGNLYKNGFGVKKDYSKAKEYYERSAEFCNSDALLNLGNLYENGFGVKKDYIKAKDYYERSAKFCNSDAFNSLGNLYEKGLGVEKNYLIAKKIYEHSSYLNNSYAHFYLGEKYSNGEYFDIDIQKAIKYYLKSIKIESGIVKEYNIISKTFSFDFKSNNYRYISYNNLGVIYLTIFNDIEKAVEYLKESAFAEYPLGQNNFGLLSLFYLNKDDNARYMFEKSAKHNFSLAEYNFGYMLEKDNKIDESIQWYIKASEHENKPLIYRNIVHNDRKLEISKTFILCLTNLKLVEYYFSLKKYDDSKKYFIKSINKLKLDDKKYPFEFSIEDYSNEYFSYIKKYILNFPLFNLKNQPNLNLNKYSDIFTEINKNNQIKKSNKSKSDIKCTFKENKMKNDDVLESKKSNDKIIFNKPNLEDINKHIYSIPNENEKICEHQDQNEKICEEPGELFDFVIQKSLLDSISNAEFDIKTLFINEIKDIIRIMKEILYTQPYIILFGNIWPEMQNQKSFEKNDSRKEIDINFYEGFTSH